MVGVCHLSLSSLYTSVDMRFSGGYVLSAALLTVASVRADTIAIDARSTTACNAIASEISTVKSAISNSAYFCDFYVST